MSPRFAVALEPRIVVAPELHRGDRVLLVALGVGGIFLQPQRVTLQVARDVLEALPWRARDESGIHQPLARGLHVLHDATQGAALRDDLRILLARLDDRSEISLRALGHGRQPRLGAFLLVFVRLRRSRRVVLADERAIDDRREEIGLELLGGNRRLDLERHRVQVVHAALEVAQLLLQL